MRISPHVGSANTSITSQHRPAFAADGGADFDPLTVGEPGLITRAVTVATGGRTGLLAVLSESDGLVEVVSVWGAPPGVDHLPSVSPADGFVGRVLMAEHAAAERLDLMRDPLLAAVVGEEDLTYAVGAAIRPPGGARGALCVAFSERPADEPSTTLWLVESYARLAALCIRDQGALDGLLAQASIDGLTGCLNHTAIRAELHRQIKSATRHDRTLSCCFIDLDGFKRHNDLLGHAHGSRVLASVANALRRELRAEDTLGRYGGDEFVALLPDSDRPAACALAQRLRATISTTALDGTSEQLDASIGVAQWRPGSTANEMLEAADKALLQAKRQGGGTVVGAGDAAAGEPRRRVGAAVGDT